MRDKSLLMAEETLFRDESVFTPGYVPKDFMHRDAQLQEIRLSLKPGLRGVNPINTLVQGPPGTGKTTAVKFVYSEIAETSKKLATVYVNCEDFSTPYAVFARIYETVHGISPPSTGKPLEDVKESIFTKLKRDGRSIIVALDEIDRLAAERNIDRVIIDLLKAHSTYGYDRIGIMGITTDETLMANLDEKSRSVYNPTRIEFGRYTKDEIKDILENRAKYGFYDGVLSERLLAEIAGRTYERGDVRFGIDLMRRSALLAEKDSSREIKKRHVDEAIKALPGIQKKEATDTITEEEKLLLDLIKAGPGEMSGRYYKTFRDKPGCGVKRYNEIIGKLEGLGLIKTEYKQGMRGRSREITPA